MSTVNEPAATPSTGRGPAPGAPAGGAGRAGDPAGWTGGPAGGLFGSAGGSFRPMGGPVDSTGGPFGSVGDPFSPAGVVFRPVSARLITVRLVGALVGVGAPAAVLAVGAIMWSPWIWAGVMVMAVLVAWVAWFVPRQVRAMGYALTDDHLLWRKGIMFRRICVVPYGRMQYVDTSQGPLAAWLGIAEVRLHTAAAATDATINGLPVEEAEHLRRLLADRGEQRMAGL